MFLTPALATRPRPWFGARTPPRATWVNRTLTDQRRYAEELWDLPDCRQDDPGSEILVSVVSDARALVISLDNEIVEENPMADEMSHQRSVVLFRVADAVQFIVDVVPLDGNFGIVQQAMVEIHQTFAMLRDDLGDRPSLAISIIAIIPQYL